MALRVLRGGHAAAEAVPAMSEEKGAARLRKLEEVISPETLARLKAKGYDLETLYNAVLYLGQVWGSLWVSLKEFTKELALAAKMAFLKQGRTTKKRLSPSMLAKRKKGKRKKGK